MMPRGKRLGGACANFAYYVTALRGLCSRKRILTLIQRADAVCFGSLYQRSPVSRGTVRQLMEVKKQFWPYFWGVMSFHLIVLREALNRSRLFSASEDGHHIGFEVDHIVDSVGSENAFTVALAIGLLMGHPLERINKSANKSASFACTQEGAFPSLLPNFRGAY